MPNKIVILGAGVSGLSAGYHLKLKGIDSLIFEKNQSYGGLCDNFTIDDFRFDKFVHFSHTRNNYVLELFSQSSDYYSYSPKASNYYHGIWLKHPVQTNLYPLDASEKVRIILDFLSAPKYNQPKNYEEWLRSVYGVYFSKNFPEVYTRKYWTLEAKYLNTSWIENRMYKPKVEEVLYGAMAEDTKIFYYASEMRYPKKGGYKSFLKYIADFNNIQFNKEVVKIDINNKKIYFQDNTSEKYDILISSLPLPELIRMVSYVPEEVMHASQMLSFTSGYLVSLGLKKVRSMENLWLYLYDEDILPSRIYFPHLKSSDNVPENLSSLQAEIYFSNFKPLNMDENEILENTIQQLISIGLFSNEDIIVKDIRQEKYANVIYDHNIQKARKIVHNFLKQQNIFYIGRFGEWAYLWSDQSLMSGKFAADKIFKIIY
ncbi:MAG TPA: FAD-dependent oxidoreductase [Defluviitoga tunisiensis]|nr:FAD-dependent oxidoreductase [Defluviitoga tunisiensis]HPP10990.1 FAD-dependent oxidoreductase [Defluviitoga tunisiensis]